MKHTSTAYKSAPLWEPISLLPSQLPLRGSYLSSPEMHLVAAIFEDAVNCLLRDVSPRRGRRWYEFLEARDWIMDDRRDWPFAFANVCELLTLDVTAVRESLGHVLVTDHTKADNSRDEPVGGSGSWDTPAAEPHRAGDSESPERERFDVVVWDEA